jgi:flagellar motor switch protein FliG
MEINIKIIIGRLKKASSTGVNCYLNDDESSSLLSYIQNLEITNSDILKEIREDLKKCQQN